MARQETVLSVFVASPNDLEEERSRLEEAINELNTTWSRSLKVRLELVKWETHAYPDFGQDPQAVINEQISNDYDLFVGLMWYRFGTPTGRAGSGTVEEFQIAKSRWDANPNSVSLMMYFKDAPVPLPPTKIDVKQLGQVAAFKNSLGSEGSLYWSFTSPDDFKQKVHLHLSRQVQAYLSKTSPQNPAFESSQKSEGHEDVEEQVEIGFIELMEEFEDSFDTLSGICERITSALVDVGAKMKAKGEEAESFAQGPHAKDKRAAKRFIANAALDMDIFTQRMASEVPVLSKYLNQGMTALTKAAEISIDFMAGDDARSQAQENLDAIKDFRETIETVNESVSDLRSSVGSIPRMTTVLNRSKRAMIHSIESLERVLNEAQGLSREAETSFLAIMRSS